MVESGAPYFTGAEDDVRLLDLLAIIWRRKGLVVGAAVGAAVLGFALSFLLPNRYAAQATLLVAPPAVTGRLDDRLRLDTTMPGQVDIQGLATTLRTMSRVRDHGVEEGWLPSDLSAEGFAQQCTVHPLPDSERMMALAVSSRSPEAAVGLTQVWATQVVALSRKVFTVHPDDLTRYEARASEASEALAHAQTNYEQTLPETRVRVREARLQAEQRNLRDQLEKIDRLEALAEDAEALRARLVEVAGGDRPLQLGEMLGLIALEAVNEGKLSGLELQVSGAEPFAAPDVASARASLQRLVNAIAAQRERLEAEASQLEARVTELATELETARHQEQLAERERDELKQVHEIVQLQKRQARLMMEDQSELVRIVVDPIMPEVPEWPPRLAIAVLVGAVAALLVGGVLVFNHRAADVANTA